MFSMSRNTNIIIAEISEFSCLWDIFNIIIKGVPETSIYHKKIHVDRKCFLSCERDFMDTM